MQDANDLGLVIDAHISLVVLETHDERRAIDLLQRVARQRDLPLFSWTVTDGLRNAGFGLQLQQSIAQHAEPEKMLEYLKNQAEPGIYCLCDFHPWLEDHPKNIRLLKDYCYRHSGLKSAVVLLSHRLTLPGELSRLSARFSMSLPSEEQISTLVREEAANWSKRNNSRKVKTDNATLKQLVANLKGLTHSEVRRLVRGAIVDDGAITEEDLPEINKAKFQLMDMDGVLSYEYRTEKFSDVAGMNTLKEWLNKRREVFLGDHGDVDPPRGILLTGVQGGGKSLSAKAVAGVWGVPLLRLDMAALYNKYHGETERNLRESLAMAERMSPCVLWIDEIEKGLATDGSDSALSQRVLGTLLTWMAERSQPVFMVATANDISKLPPELVRKGRFDELFFVDLPDLATRCDIFRIHLDKRSLSSNDFDLQQLAQASEGFSGAEIEQVVVATLYSAKAGNSEPVTAAVLNEIHNTAPLSQVMAERIAALRAWASERGVVAV
ncbi:AAA family ATPase [Porticoccus sp. W117]|uniref:AAA family ATPase n=1 Tax=Porticoccus sp. W117 TaxID=3054777 RepID=UPI00259A868E|nr:AAA family ATPase [Porticoccus sp. W117]MDM3870576.1 AAA family ATPase [Porticoccus sp. W117]